MPRDLFRPALHDYIVYHKLLEVTDGFSKEVMISNLNLAKKLRLEVREVDAAIMRLEQGGYISGQWVTGAGAA